MANTIKKNTNSTQNKSQTHRAKQYEVMSFLSTDCEHRDMLEKRLVFAQDVWSGEELGKEAVLGRG